jgi:CubicO group peptidase (beta-lactamase class C family)
MFKTTSGSPIARLRTHRRLSTSLWALTVEFNDRGTVRQVALADLLRSTDTHAFIVVANDQLLLERYFNGYRRDSLCVSMSMAKSFTSALVGIAIDDGLIKSADDPIINYLHELKEDRGFDAVTIRHLLTMGSGIKFVTTPFPWSDDPLAYFHPDLRTILLSGLTIVERPGQSFHYNSYNPELLGLILERTTHRSPSDYLQEKIWKPLGMEYPATWRIDSEEDGMELMQSAINASAIDYAKFGQLYVERGNWNGKQIISEHWVTESTRPDPNDRRPWESDARWHDQGGYYRYFWWGISSGDKEDYCFMARGKYGPFIFVSPKARVVIVRTAKNSGIDDLARARIFQYIADRIGDDMTGSAP